MGRSQASSICVVSCQTCRRSAVRDRFAADETIHQVLIARVAEFHDDVVEDTGEARIADQRKPECMNLDVAVVVADGDEWMGLEGSPRSRRSDRGGPRPLPSAEAIGRAS